MATRIQVQPSADIQNALPKLRTMFCQLLEELKIRRENDRESDKRIKELVSVQHGLEEELEENAIKLQRIRDEQRSKLDEQRRMFEDKIKDSELEKAKTQLLYDTSMKEIKALRDEIRKLNLSKFSFEKIIKDQECKLQLMNSSRDSYQLQISQIETQSTHCGQQLAELEQALNSLQNNATAAMSINEEVRIQNTNYSSQLDSMREESNRLLEKVYKNPLYELRQLGEEKNSCEVVRLKVQNKFNEGRILDLEREVSNVNLNLSNTQKSLQECYKLITNQSRAYKRMEDEVERCEKGKMELEKEREEEIDEFKIKIKSIEEEKEKLFDKNIQIRKQLELVTAEKVIEGGDTEHQYEYLSPGMVTGVDMEPIALCPDSQETAGSQGSTTHSANHEKYEVILNSQETVLKEIASEPQDNPHLQYSMPNKRAKLDSHTSSPLKSPISPTDS